MNALEFLNRFENDCLSFYKGGQRPGQGNPGQNNPGQNPGQGGQRPDQNKPGQGGQR